MTDYTPVDCGLHSEYELATMQHRRLALSWRDEAQVDYSKTVTPVDLYTQDGGEFLRVRDSHDLEHIIRLDRITACEFLQARNTALIFMPARSITRKATLPGNPT